MESMEKWETRKNGWKRRQSRLLWDGCYLLLFFGGGGGEFEFQGFPLSSLDYSLCVSKHKMHFHFRIEDKKMTMCYLHWPIKVGISYIQTCMYVTCIHIIDACIYLCVDTHTHTRRDGETSRFNPRFNPQHWDWTTTHGQVRLPRCRKSKVMFQPRGEATCFCWAFRWLLCEECWFIFVALILWNLGGDQH